MMFFKGGDPIIASFNNGVLYVDVGDNESVNHLFLHCPLVQSLWNKLFDVVGICCAAPKTMSSMIGLDDKDFSGCRK